MRTDAIGNGLASCAGMTSDATLPTAAIHAPRMLGLHVGWHELHSDVSLNFQLNRFGAYGGAAWLADVREALPQLRSYDAWQDTFLVLGEHAASQGRVGHAALHFRCAEFFMTSDDPRKEPLRARLLPMLREAAGVPASARHDVPFGRWLLPAWHLPSADQRGTIVACGGFDSYAEELLPVFVRLKDAGWSVIAFEGPGQGAVLEDQHAPMTPDWHLPLGAVLDAFGLEDVTLVGISLGGCLAIRAAAKEPRVSRVVAFDVLTDLFACMTAQVPPPVAALLRGALAVGATRSVDRGLSQLARTRPVVKWGLARAMHVFGCEHPVDSLLMAREFHTRDVSHLVSQDVLLLAGANDHYVPLAQLWEQTRLLSAARSITARVFTAKEHAQAHCQVGNLPLALGVISQWVSSAAGR